MSNNLATIIVPTYNSEKYVLKMLNSIHNQSYRPLKLIIIDDNSTDNTRTIIENWIEKLKDEKIDVQFIRNKLNKGLTNNINYGVFLAQGRYILFADHDDIWEPRKVEIQIKFLEDNDNVVCCFTDRSLINEKDVKFVNSEFNLIGFKKSIARFNDLCNYNARFSSNTICFKNIGSIKNIFPIDSKIIQHDYYVTLMLSKYNDIGYIHEPLVKYRIHTNNLSGNYYNLIISNYKDFSKARKYSCDLWKKVVTNDKILIENIFYNKFQKKINLNYNSNCKYRLKRCIPSFIVYFLNKRKNKKFNINFS